MILLDLVFPKFCISCKKWGRYICNTCTGQIEFFNEYVCITCGRPSNSYFIHPSCQGDRLIQGVISSMLYAGIVKKLVKSIKYQLVYDIYKELYDLVINREASPFNLFYKTHPNCYLQPIPLHPNRFKKRGFNQATELAKLFARKYPYPIIDCLVRIKDTKPQATLQKQQRKENISGAFSIKNNFDIRGKTIILIDDVYTSGSTCAEAARLLHAHGVQKVFVWSLARD